MQTARAWCWSGRRIEPGAAARGSRRGGFTGQVTAMPLKAIAAAALFGFGAILGPTDQQPFLRPQTGASAGAAGQCGCPKMPHPEMPQDATVRQRRAAHAAARHASATAFCAKDCRARCLPGMPEGPGHGGIALGLLPAYGAALRTDAAPLQPCRQLLHPTRVPGYPAGPAVTVQRQHDDRGGATVSCETTLDSGNGDADPGRRDRHVR